MMNALRWLFLTVPFCLGSCALVKGPPVLPPAAVEQKGIPDAAAPRIVLLLTVILLAMSLASCALYRPSGSWVDETVVTEGAIIAGAITAIVMEKIPPRKKPIRLVPPPPSQANNEVTRELNRQLEQAGYVLTDSSEGAHSLLYFVSTRDKGFVVRIKLDGVDATTLLGRAATGELLAGTITVREDANE